MKIKTKLSLLAVMIVLSVLFLVSTMYLRTSSVMLSLANGEAMGTVEDQAKMIDLYFAGLISIGENASPGVKTLIDSDGYADKEELKSLMAQLLKSNLSNNMMNIYVGLQTNGKLYTGSGFEPGDDFDARTRPWYTDAVSARKTIVTDPYIDTETKKLVISTGTPLFDNSGKLLGVLGTDVDLKILADTIKQAKVFNSGFGILLTKDGTFMEHPDPAMIANENISKTSSKINGDMAKVGARVIEGRPGFDDYKTGDVERRLFFTQSATGYIAGLVFPHSEINMLVRSATLMQILTGLGALVIIVVFMLFTIPSITRPLEKVRDSLERLADLDLTIDHEAAAFENKIDKSTELGMMVASLQNLRGSFAGIVSAVNEEVHRTSSSAQQLNELTSKVTGEVASTQQAILNVERMTEEALRGVEGASKALEEVSHAATMTATSATEGAEASSTTSRLSAEVVEMVNGFVESLEHVGRTSAENSKGMENVGSSVSAIGEFVSTIAAIASQTNLLALNAAIEAARAGEAGRGFAVVAEEVRKLAEESNVASRHVAEMMESLQTGTSNAILSTQEAASIISGIIEKAGETQRSLEVTLSEIGRVNDAVQTIAAAAEEQAASSNEISESANQVRDSVSSVANEVKIVSRVTGQTVALIENVSGQSGNLSEIALHLAKIMEDFKIDSSKPAMRSLRA